MAQDNLFNSTPNFDGFNSNSFDLSMQFAASVPQTTTQRPIHFTSPNDLLVPNTPSMVQHYSSDLSSFSQAKADKRAEHNAIERARRESFNVKFQQLALVLPNCQNGARSSKSTIIDRTLEFVRLAISKEEHYQRRIKELEKFNAYLLNQSEKRYKRKRSKQAFDQSPPLQQQLPQTPSISFQSNDSYSSSDEEEDVNEVFEQNIKHSSGLDSHNSVSLKRKSSESTFHSASTTTHSSNSLNPTLPIHNSMNNLSQSNVQLVQKSLSNTNSIHPTINNNFNSTHWNSLHKEEGLQSLFQNKFQNNLKLEQNQDHFNQFIMADTSQQNIHLMHRR